MRLVDPIRSLNLSNGIPPLNNFVLQICLTILLIQKYNKFDRKQKKERDF